MDTQVPGKQPAMLRFEVFTCGPILGRSGHYLVLHMSKNGVATTWPRTRLPHQMGLV